MIRFKKEQSMLTMNGLDDTGGGDDWETILTVTVMTRRETTLAMTAIIGQRPQQRRRR